MFKQITVFLENKPGRLEEVTGCLAAAGINLHALSLADTTDFGILRLIVSDPEAALTVLRENDFMVKTAEVLAVATGHTPGSLHKVLQALSEQNISIEYMYAFTSHHKDYDAVLIFNLSDQAAAAKKLKERGIAVLGREFLSELNKDC